MIVRVVVTEMENEGSGGSFSKFRTLGGVTGNSLVDFTQSAYVCWGIVGWEICGCFGVLLDGSGEVNFLGAIPG